MPKKIKPFPIHGKVAPMTEVDFRFSSGAYGEKTLFDAIASEHVRLIGTEIEYYSLDRTGTNVDPLYGETVEPKWLGPFRMVGHMEWPDSLPEMREEGFRQSIIVGCWISRLEFENAHAAFPREGDVLRVWKIPFFNDTDGGGITPGSQYAFTVADVDDDGHLFDNPDFVGFRLDLRRNSEFAPERRVTPP
jgi:hypothetical protein